GTLSAYGAWREVEQLHRVLENDQRKLFGWGDVCSGLDIIQAHSSKPLEPEGVELAVAEPDREFAGLGERGRHNDKPRRSEVPRPPGAYARIALDEQLAPVHGPPTSTANLIEQVFGKRSV